MIDVQEAKRFLCALSSQDGGEIFSFQTLYDVKAEHDVDQRLAEEKRLTRTIHGRFDEVVDKLAEMNSEGAGVFVCVNRTTGMGLRGKDVNRIRSFFVDDDTDHLRPEDLELAPSIVVRTKRGYHFYWLASDSTSKDSFGPAQKALAERFDTDSSIFNLNRVMRIPGFMHNKGDPFMVTLEHVDEQISYALSDMAGAFGLDIEAHTYKPRVIVDSEDISTIPIEKRIQRAQGQLRAIGPAVRNSGDGHSKTMSACRVGNDFAIEDFTFLGLLQDWGSTCDPPWDDQQLETFYYSTLASIDSSRFPWGGKLLDPNYKSSRPAGVNPATAYRGENVPWSANSADTRSSNFSAGLSSVAGSADYDGPDIPAESLRPTASKQVVSVAALPQEQLVPSGLSAEEARAVRRARNQRIGAPVHHIMRNPPDPDDTKRPAREMAHKLCDEYEFCRDDAKCVYIYSESYWQETSREMIDKFATQYTTFADLTVKKMREASGLALSERHIAQIKWNQVKKTEVPLKNGVLDFMTGEIREHSSSDYLDRIIPIDYDADATCELWLQCLEDWLPGMPEEHEALQQFFGYILMPHALYKKALILYGDPDTGKSQICNIATALVGGTKFVCSITPDSMDDPKKLAPIKGKSLNCVPDLKRNTVLADGGFKQLVSTGDAIQLDQKFTRQETYIPTAKHLFATNNLPSIRDMTDAVFRRLLILGFNHPVPLEKQDSELEAKLEKELPGILRWAVDGARKLYTNSGRWPTVKSSQELLKDYKLEQNPLFFYIRESGEVISGDMGRVPTEELRNKMNEFNGTKPYGRKNFNKLVEGLATDFPGIYRDKVGGKSFVKGLKWSDGQETLEFDA